MISVALKPRCDRAKAIGFVDPWTHGACYVDEFVRHRFVYIERESRSFTETRVALGSVTRPLVGR